MLRKLLSRPALLAALLSSSAGGALAFDAPSPEPWSVAAAPAPAKLPAVPPLTAEQLAEDAALASDIESEEMVPAPVTLADVAPRPRPVPTVEGFADLAWAPSAQTAFDLESFVPSTLEDIAPADFTARASVADIADVSVALEETVPQFVPPVAFDEPHVKGRVSLAQLDFGAVAAPQASPSEPSTARPAQSFTEAMAALASPTPEAEPVADGAPLALAMAGSEEGAKAPGTSVAPRRRPKVSASATAEGGPEVPLVFELRRK